MKNSTVRVSVPQLLRRFNAVDTAHLDVQKDHVDKLLIFQQRLPAGKQINAVCNFLFLKKISHDSCNLPRLRRFVIAYCNSNHTFPSYFSVFSPIIT